MFTDRVVLKLKAGKGGDGITAWRRERYLPKGGPYGGDGGDGGSVIFEADSQLYSLESLSNFRQMSAENGDKGKGNLCQGRRGEDLIIKVPAGTLLWLNQELLFDFTKDKERFVVCQGGKGGLGNAHFKTPFHRAPYESTTGTLGEEKEVTLELKLIADVGLIGFPNAGKSTLLSKLANVKLKIGAYPFTTLFPSIAPLIFEEGRRLIVADIPGIMEGAHKNKGLGLQFLRHIERTRILVFVIDAAGSEDRDPMQDYNVLLSELEAYNPALLDKPRFVVLNKMDLEGAKEKAALFKERFSSHPLFEMAAALNEGVEALFAHLGECGKTSSVLTLHNTIH